VPREREIRRLRVRRKEIDLEGARTRAAVGAESAESESTGSQNKNLAAVIKLALVPTLE